ncbi:hypothetical protein ONS95_010460 [Cadophora gregata]|uniref:uncharacterized protein n=1 Tax=Cadophora gregata TaxID=51156 RepID=UPI0026DAADC6|nr:uncharacterized protein ONS95_010460 [Cadophora gregata]KAK0122203.1 hypothetical protein ONS95_010460 [Cadophora gregata]
MLLIDLSPEIINLIVHFLGLSGKPLDLCGLALSCRFLSVVVRPAIPSIVDLKLPSSRLSLLQRSIDEDPSYGHGVRSATLQRDNRRGSVDETETREAIETFLLSTPAIRDLHLNEFYMPGVARFVLSTSLTLWTTLRKLKLADPQMNFTELVDLLSRHQFRHLEAAHLNIMEVLEPPRETHPQSGLTYLDLRKSRIEDYVLGIILRRLPAVHTIRYRLPRSVERQATATAAQMNANHLIFPNRVELALLKASKTLTRLDLSILYRRGRLVPDPARIDLSGMTALKELKISALYFFLVLNGGRGVLTDHPSRNGLYKLLPQSLEALQMHFPNETEIFYPNPGQGSPERDRFVNGDMDASSYEWILELATFLPSLRYIFMNETHYNPGRPMNFDLEKWDAPGPIKILFEEAGIDVDIRVRVPRMIGVGSALRGISDLPDLFD